MLNEFRREAAHHKSLLDYTKKTKEHGTVVRDNMEKEIKKINEAKTEYRATVESIRTEHTMIKRIQGKHRVDFERERQKVTNASLQSDRPMSSMSIQSSRASWGRSKSFQSG